MRKNRGEDAKKACKKALKTGSEKKESVKAKKAKVRADVVSEKAIDEVDYPPELLKFLGEILQGLKEQLGLADGEDIPEDARNEYFRKMLAGVDVERLVHEIKSEGVFGIEPDESVPAYGADKEADDADDMLDDEDGLTDDELFNIDPSKLKAGTDGIRLLAEFTLECKEKPMGMIRQMFPVQIDEEFIKNRVYVLINIPFVLSIPLADITPDSEYSEMSGAFLTDMTTAYKIPEDAYAELNEILDRCGVVNAQKEIKEGEDVVGRISEYFASGDVIDTDFAPREDGYYEDTMEYWYEGSIYHEMDVIWFELPRNVDANGRMRAMCINLDSFPDLCEPCDITRAKTIKVENFRRVLSEEERIEIIRYGKNPEFFERLLPEEMVWFLASEYAKKQETSGYCVVCKNGKFNVPVESIFNPTTLEYEHLVIAFNSMPCGEDHHKCTGVLVADVGNIQMYTAVRYHKNQVIDWRKRINQELQAIFLKNPNFDMYADPYDDPHNAYGDETPT